MGFVCVCYRRMQVPWKYEAFEFQGILANGAYRLVLVTSRFVALSEVSGTRDNDVEEVRIITHGNMKI